MSFSPGWLRMCGPVGSVFAPYIGMERANGDRGSESPEDEKATRGGDDGFGSGRRENEAGEKRSKKDKRTNGRRGEVGERLRAGDAHVTPTNPSGAYVPAPAFNKKGGVDGRPEGGVHSQKMAAEGDEGSYAGSENASGGPRACEEETELGGVVMEALYDFVPEQPDELEVKAKEHHDTILI